MKNETAQLTVRKIVEHCNSLPVGPHVNTQELARRVGFSAKSFGTGARYDELTAVRILMDGDLWWGNPATIALLKDGLGERV